VEAAASGRQPAWWGRLATMQMVFTDILAVNQIQMPKILLHKLDSMYTEASAI
jgi:hypothetical protein